MTVNDLLSGAILRSEAIAILEDVMEQADFYNDGPATIKRNFIQKVNEFPSLLDKPVLRDADDIKGRD